MKTCVILNPAAGSAAAEDGLTKQLARLDPAEVHRTDQCGDAKRLAREAIQRGCELIVAAGGDGTLNEVINGIRENGGNTRLALIPLGTGNDFARTLGLPDTLEECVNCIADGATRPIDLVRVTSDSVRYFLNVSAGGFSGIVNEKLTTEIKQGWGPLAYLRSAAAALPELRAYNATIVLDDAQPLSMSLYNVIVGNGRYVAGGIPVAPEALPDDGLLDVILIAERPATDLAMTIARILLGSHLTDDGIVFRRAARIAVRSDPGMWFNVDGELVGNEPAVFEVLHGAIRFIVPAS